MNKYEVLGIVGEGAYGTVLKVGFVLLSIWSPSYFGR